MTTSRSQFVAACVEMSSGTSVAENLDEIALALSVAKDLGADCVFLPECCNLMQRDGEAAYREARFARKEGLELEAKSGDVTPDAEQTYSLQDEVSFLAHLAKQHGFWLQAGSLALRHASIPQKLVNRALLFSPDGEVTAYYDKINMFDVELQHGESYCESNSYIAGTRAVLARLPWSLPWVLPWSLPSQSPNTSADKGGDNDSSSCESLRGNLGLSICYDLRFPRLYRHLAESGALFFAVPSAFTKTTGEVHWRSLLRARAIENGCFVFAAAQKGLLQDGRACWGRSMIISPWGEVLAISDEEAGETEGGDKRVGKKVGKKVGKRVGKRVSKSVIITAEIDTAQISLARSRIPALLAERKFESCC